MYGRGGGGYRPSGGSGLGFGPAFTPPVVKQLLIANGAVFLMQLVLVGITELFGVVPYLVWQQGYLWQPFTYMWLHSPNAIGHILMNMFVLWMFGSPLAMAWGPRRFLRYYLICGIGAGFLIATVPYLMTLVSPAAVYAIHIPTVGASGAIYGLLLAYSLTWPDRTIMLIFPPVAFRAIWLIPLMFVTTFLFGGGNISHVGHLGGVLVGWLILRRQGDARNPVSLGHLKHRWRRYQMRKKLKAVQDEEWQARRRDQDRKYH